MKILFTGLNWLGDIIMSLPAITATAQKHEVHILSRPGLAGVYKLAAKYIQKVHTIDSKNINFSALKEIKELKKQKFDHIIVLPDSFRTALLAWACKGKCRTGYNTQGRSFLLNQAIEKPANFVSWHESDLHFNLVKKAKLAEHKTELVTPDFSPKDFIKTCNRLAIDSGKPYAILAPGAAFGAAKRWPAANFAQLAHLLLKNRDLQIILTGSKKEASICNKIKELAPETLDISGETSLIELSLLLSRAKFLVANDSGTMHLAALNQTPTVVPVGPTDMTRTGALNKNIVYVYSKKKCSLAPCRKRECPLNNHICMRSIAAIDVLQALKELAGSSL
ncbi:MAG: lipopolysaccharide heptosyltransferase II [Candidatus Rifleibacteriota bacterium]